MKFKDRPVEKICIPHVTSSAKGVPSTVEGKVEDGPQTFLPNSSLTKLGSISPLKTYFCSQSR